MEGEDGRFDLMVRVPANMSMEVVLPASGVEEGERAVGTVFSGIRSFSVPYERNYDWPPKSVSLP